MTNKATNKEPMALGRDAKDASATSADGEDTKYTRNGNSNPTDDGRLRLLFTCQVLIGYTVRVRVSVFVFVLTLYLNSSPDEFVDRDCLIPPAC